MTLAHRDPFRGLLGLQSRLNRMISDAQYREGDSNYGQWVPAVDIFEKGEDLVIRAELPGLSAGDIDVRVENNTLHLSGERKHDSEVDEARTYRTERVYGTFARTFSLPTTVDAGKIAARHKDGILEIVLPKLDGAKPRKVQIHAA